VRRNVRAARDYELRAGSPRILPALNSNQTCNGKEAKRPSAMTDLKSPTWIWLKGWLFLGLGLAAATLAFLESPTVRQAFYLAVTIWAFCRFYYFTFYVIERYVDPGFRFSGLWAFARYWWSLRKR
jgi:hypothetical protein